MSLIDPLIAQSLLRLLGIAGVALFAATGALAAARQRLDVVAAGFFAVVTATGGGTVRDLLIGPPVFWMEDATPVLGCVVVAAAVWLVPLRRWPARAIDWFDAAGLSAFSAYGAGKALVHGVSPVSAIAMGVVTACLGGVIRDMVAGVPSMMLRNELYVTAALVAASSLVGFLHMGLSQGAASILATTIGFVMRGAAIRWRLALPRHRG